jgi:hypothetical protein
VGIAKRAWVVAGVALMVGGIVTVRYLSHQPLSTQRTKYAAGLQ